MLHYLCAALCCTHVLKMRHIFLNRLVLAWIWRSIQKSTFHVNTFLMYYVIVLLFPGFDKNVFHYRSKWTLRKLTESHYYLNLLYSTKHNPICTNLTKSAAIRRTNWVFLRIPPHSLKNLSKIQHTAVLVK